MRIARAGSAFPFGMLAVGSSLKVRSLGWLWSTPESHPGLLPAGSRQRGSAEGRGGCGNCGKSWNSDVPSRGPAALRWILWRCGVSGVLLAAAEDKSRNPVTFPGMLTPFFPPVLRENLPRLWQTPRGCFVPRKLCFLARKRKFPKFSVFRSISIFNFAVSQLRAGPLLLFPFFFSLCVVVT